MAAAERPRFGALRRALVVDAERCQASECRAARRVAAGRAGVSLGSGVLARLEHGQLEAAPEIGPRAFAGDLEAPQDLVAAVVHRRGRLIGRHGDVDGNRRERRADLALMARHAPLLLPQQLLARAAVLAAAARALSRQHSSSRRKSAVTGHLGLDANRALEPAAERDGHALQHQRRDLETLELQPRANRPSCEPEADEREQQGRRPRAVLPLAISPGTNIAAGSEMRFHSTANADRDVRGRAGGARDAAIRPFGPPAPRFVGESLPQNLLRRPSSWRRTARRTASPKPTPPNASANTPFKREQAGAKLAIQHGAVRDSSGSTYAVTGVPLSCAARVRSRGGVGSRRCCRRPCRWRRACPCSPCPRSRSDTWPSSRTSCRLRRPRAPRARRSRLRPRPAAQPAASRQSSSVQPRPHERADADGRERQREQHQAAGARPVLLLSIENMVAVPWRY